MARIVSVEALALEVPSFTAFGCIPESFMPGAIAFCAFLVCLGLWIRANLPC